MFDKFLMKHKITSTIFFLLLTSLLRAIAVAVFFVPYNIANGGASGIATIISTQNQAWHVYQGLITFLINVPLLILAFFYLNKMFVFLTLVATGISSLFTYIFQKFLIQVEPGRLIFGDLATTPDKSFVATLVGGILWGIALGFLLKINCSTGGSDIVGLLLQNKFKNLKVVWIIFAFDCMIGIMGGIFSKGQSKLETALYSVIAIYMASFIADKMQKGFASTFEVKIITDKHEEIGKYIINDLKRGLTAFKGTGMYTKSDKFFLVCIIRKRQLQELKENVMKIDPNAFFYITQVPYISGLGFKTYLNPSSKIGKINTQNEQKKKKTPEKSKQL